MTVIGFMHHRKKPTNRAYAFAAVAKTEGAELLYFSPGKVDFQTKKIKGFVYRSGGWIKITSDFPDVVCNVVGFSKDSQNKTVEKLSGIIPFTSYSVGTKATVYNNITRYNKFANYLVPTVKVTSAKQFLDLLARYKEIVFKPSSGCQGTNVYYVEKENEGFRVLAGADKANWGLGQIQDFIQEKISTGEYLVQPYINCRTKRGDPYDLRLHVQKGARGEWVITKIYPRIAESGSIVCNLSRGGHTLELVPFLKREFGSGYLDVQKSVEIFSLQLAAHMDTLQKDIYNEELDELGIDIGLDAGRKIWIYEINWRPGCPPSLNIELNVVRNAILYAMSLVK